MQCSAPFDGASRTSIEAGSVVGASEDGDSRLSCGLRNKVMRRGQRVQGRNRTVVGGGAQGWVGGVCDGRLTHGADGSGAGAKD